MFPVERFGDGADVGFFDWVAAFDGVGQKQDFFLDVGGARLSIHMICVMRVVEVWA